MFTSCKNASSKLHISNPLFEVVSHNVFSVNGRCGPLISLKVESTIVAL